MMNNHKKNTVQKLLEQKSYDYIRNQKKLLVISVVSPSFSLVVSLINILFLLVFGIPHPQPSNSPPASKFLELVFLVFFPFIIIITISIFAYIKFVFLIQWRQKVKLYKQKRKTVITDSGNNDAITITTTLTEMFYDIAKHMEKIKFVFILLNILFIINFHWFSNFFLVHLGIINNTESLPVPSPNIILGVLNILSTANLAFYLVYEWFHFLKWNKKQKILTNYERMVYNELELDKE